MSHVKDFLIHLLSKQKLYTLFLNNYLETLMNYAGLKKLNFEVFTGYIPLINYFAP
jgi:hypothetical protein